jgi:hypothetical protein
MLVAVIPLAGCAAAARDVTAAPPAPAPTLTPAGPRAPAPALPSPTPGAPLRVRLAEPGPVTGTVGHTVRVRVAWSDGDGVLAGRNAEWGEDVGIGAARTGRGACPSPTAAPRSGTVTFAHVWGAPGTYQVRLAVVTAACGARAGTLEEAAVTVPVTVTAAG